MKLYQTHKLNTDVFSPHAPHFLTSQTIPHILKKPSPLEGTEGVNFIPESSSFAVVLTWLKFSHVFFKDYPHSTFKN
jgi:hypothetical protein